MTDTNSPDQTPIEQETTDATESPPEVIRSDATVTSLNRKWLVKMVIIILVLVGFGFWALYDAKVAYPARGANASEYYEYQYLDLIAKTRPPLSNDAGIPDPVERLAQIRERQKQTGSLDPIETARLRWLESLELIDRLTPDATALPRADFRGVDVPTAADRYTAVTKKWTTAEGGAINAPKPLSGFDIPSQWAILAICWAIAVWILLTVVRASIKVYRWEPSNQTLRLPDGGSITPGDIAEFDKRKWHKFYVVLRVRDGHPTHAGRSIEVDLLRHVPLEQWILDMEKTANPDSTDAPQPAA